MDFIFEILFEAVFVTFGDVAASIISDPKFVNRVKTIVFTVIYLLIASFFAFITVNVVNEYGAFSDSAVILYIFDSLITILYCVSLILLVFRKRKNTK